MKKLYSIILILLFFSCDNDGESAEPALSENTPNILFIIADDLGKDAINGFSQGSIKPNTPNLDAIRNAGLIFTNFWVYPTCSPTRACIITGKYGYRTGVKWASDPLSQSEMILQQYINRETNNKYATAIVGKWHLSGNNASVDPETFGVEYFAGLMRGGTDDYSNWLFSEDGNSTTNTEYITQKFTDLAIDWINQQDKPWFMWLAYTAPHTPFHIPPIEMHNQGSLPAFSDDLDGTPYYMAMIEAMDYQIGRLLENIPTDERENTIILFIGDNGTPKQVAQSPFSRNKAKGSIYQGGVNVPMFISGKGVTRIETDDNLITSTDIFATILEITGVDIQEINDSKSFKSLFTQSNKIRNFQYTEMDDGTLDAWAISNGEYKLIESANGSKEMYDLINDPNEINNLLEEDLTVDATNAQLALEAELLKIRN